MNSSNERSGKRTKSGNELLSVRIDGQEFALDIMTIREIRGWVPVTHLAHAPSYVKGMINLRGVVLLIVDLAERLGLPSQEPSSASVVVVIEHESQVIGLLVDAVSDIIAVTEGMRQVTPNSGQSASQEFIEGLLMINGKITSIVSIAAVLPNDVTVEALFETT